MKKTLVTLDFDGTVSPIDHTRKFLAEDGWKTLNFGFRCDVHETVLDLLINLKKLSVTEEIEIVWVSTWEASTEDFESKSGGLVPHFPWIDVSKGKDEAIREKVRDGQFARVVVLEDQTKVMNSIKKALRSIPNVDSLLVKPKVTAGITASHIKTVQAFLNS